MDRLDSTVGSTTARDGGLVVTCRDLSERITRGGYLARAIVEAADAMDGVFGLGMAIGWLFASRNDSSGGAACHCQGSWSSQGVVQPGRLTCY